MVLFHTIDLMSGPSDHAEQGRRADAMEFLRTELAAALIFATLAERHRKLGRRKAAHDAVASAERGFEELAGFLYGPKNAQFITESDRDDLKYEVGRLRTKLDALQGT